MGAVVRHAANGISIVGGISALLKLRRWPTYRLFRWAPPACEGPIGWSCSLPWDSAMPNFWFRRFAACGSLGEKGEDLGGNGWGSCNADGWMGRVLCRQSGRVLNEANRLSKYPFGGTKTMELVFHGRWFGGCVVGGLDGDAFSEKMRASMDHAPGPSIARLLSPEWRARGDSRTGLSVTVISKLAILQGPAHDGVQDPETKLQIPIDQSDVDFPQRGRRLAAHLEFSHNQRTPAARRNNRRPKLLAAGGKKWSYKRCTRGLKLPT